MILKHVQLLCFLLPSIICQRSQGNTYLRGNSFGLENYLFQTYEKPEVNTIRNLKIKRVRPVPIYKTTTTQTTFELENHPQQYESSRLKPMLSNVENRKRRPAEPKFESDRLNVQNTDFISEHTTAQPLQEPVTVLSQIVQQEVPTLKVKKRIMMRRRRKRPQNITSSDDNGEAAGVDGFKPVRIPVFSQAPKVSFAAKLPDLGPTLTQNNIKSTAETEAPIALAETTIAENTFETTTTLQTITTEKPSTINLKTFLKQQTETLSLSELLQIQNLSLADLLRGNKDASVILKAKQEIASTTSAPTATLKRKIYNRVHLDITTKEIPKTEIVEVTTLKPNYSRFHPKLPRIKPTNQIYFKTQQHSENAEENLEDIKKPNKRPNFFNQNSENQNRLNDLRMKLRNFQRKTSTTDLILPSSEKPTTTTTTTTTPTTTTTTTTTTTEVPHLKKNKVFFQSANNPELSLILPTKVRPAQDQNRPERLSFWNNRLPPNYKFGQDKVKQNDDIQPQSTTETILNKDFQNSENDEESPTTVPVIFPEEIKKPEPKDELIEMLKSGHNANKLQKILSARNMTLQQLLDNREKLSMQQNISELFTSPTQPPITTQTPTLFDSLPNFLWEERNSPKISEAENYDEPYAEESAPTIARVELIPNRESKQFHLEETQPVANSDLELHFDDLLTDATRAQDSALWNLSQKSLYYGGSYGYEAQVIVPQTTEKRNALEIKPPLSNNDRILLETFSRSQNANRKFKLDFNEIIKEEEIPEQEDIEKSYIPPAVKSAIIASGVVMGIALFVFIAIFATCGWKQRQIRLKGSSSILGDTLTKNTEKHKRTNTLSPVSFKDNKSYKKTYDFNDDSSESGSSNAGSYLWSTLKNTFTTRTNTLKSRFEKEEKLREDKSTLRKNESRRKPESIEEDKTNSDQIDFFPVKKLDRDRSIINTSFHFNSKNTVSHFNDCVHGY